MTGKNSVVFLASIALVLLNGSSAFVIPHGSSPLGRSPARADIRTSSARQQPRQQPRQQQRQPTPWLEMAAGSAEEDPEMNAMDKALVAWGVKSPPGEPEIDFKEKIKSAGVAGALAYGATELAFWIVSVPLAIFTYYETTGEWLDLTSLEGKEKLFGLTAGFLTFARLVVPLRIALALALTPAMDKYVVKVFFNKGDAAASEKGDGAEAVEMTEPAEVWQSLLSPKSVSEGDSIKKRLRDAELQERVRVLREGMDS